MKRYRLHVVGQTPLLMDRMSMATLESLRTSVRLPEVKDKPAIETCAPKIYRNEEGKIALPVEMLMGALVAGGRKVKNGRSQISTAKTTTVFDFLTILSSELLLTREDGVVDAKGDIPWTVDMRKGIGNQAKTPTAVCIVRPKFDKWEFDLEIEVDEKVCNPEIARRLVDTALFSEGLGSFRPNKRGPFGKSKVTSWVEVNDGAESDASDEASGSTEAKPKGRKRELAGAGAGGSSNGEAL